jgi:tetratricopeptide (TPR) repeat protein
VALGRTPDQLLGRRDERVFVGGQYDFLPTLREIAHILEAISCPERRVIPVIPYDIHIARHEIMPYDLEILRQCRLAIFDLSDLGAQLVEMREAAQNRERIDTLLVYPVRERRNEPQRGRVTVESFGFPHFGYRSFDELRGIVWRFVTKTAADRDYSPRLIHDPILDRELRRVRLLQGQERFDRARAVLQELLGAPRYASTIEVWLQMAMVGHLSDNSALRDEGLTRAAELTGHDLADEAEVFYYRGLFSALDGEWEAALEQLRHADERRSSDGRTLAVMGFVLRRLDDIEGAMDAARRALDDFYFPDPIMAITALNNLGYLYAELYERGNEEETELLQKARDLTDGLPDYHEVFGRRRPSWLDTRGWILHLAAKNAHQRKQRDAAQDLARQAMRLLGQVRQLRGGDTQLYSSHWQQALRFEETLRAD